VDPELGARLDRARADLRATMAQARAALEAARVRSSPGREEIAQLQEDARSGRLGPDMQRLAGHVAAGDTSWEAVFDGTSPYKELLRGHLTEMGDRYAEPVRRTLEDDPTFDPGETSPGV
jgi:hypothetical protein